MKIAPARSLAELQARIVECRACPRLVKWRERVAAEKVRRWGDVVELEPLNAFDRRIIHQALKDDPNIETHSVEVEGTDKKAILLRPKR